MAQGGKRAGAGKPKGYKAPHTLEASVARARMVERISARTDELVDKLFERALDEKGDTVAIKELLDRGYGKPQQAMELSNPDGSLKTIIIQKANGHSNDKPTS
jgi:hypothetical protein